MNKTLRTACNTFAVVHLVAGLSLSAFAAVADELVLAQQVEIAGTVATIACAEEDVAKIDQRYAACMAIFDGDTERNIANTYCKPLAVAQACSHKPITH
ncbi:Uncharacterised protein [Ectopseudomonas mendocina]|uniref:Uncharacterized protein n=1 Tax=Ectopseudomonas mendocina TaxID=300 RepID=A0A379PPU8_ECTME|nr:hypothetical protein [Pseudomonas mendocina]SUE95864.1 Uncharacterised protein [Pseudomonas mendocina]